jgi:hypothetical protein
LTREIIVVALGEIGPGQDPLRILRTDVSQRLEHPLDAIIEPEMGRTFGIVVSEDDFSAAGEMELKPASVDGKETDFREVAGALAMARELVAQGAAEKERARGKSKRAHPK